MSQARSGVLPNPRRLRYAETTQARGLGVSGIAQHPPSQQWLIEREYRHRREMSKPARLGIPVSGSVPSVGSPALVTLWTMAPRLHSPHGNSPEAEYAST